MKMQPLKTTLLFFQICLTCMTFAGCDRNISSKDEAGIDTTKGELLVKANCKVCHAQGINGAPIIGNKKMWADRLPKGIEALSQNAINGVGLMPPKGGKTSLSDKEIQIAVQYMVTQAQ